MEVSTLRIAVDATDVKAADAALGGISKTSQHAETALSRLTKIASVGATAWGAYRFAVQGVASAQANLAATAKMEAVIRATGIESGVTAQQLHNLTKELQSNTIYTSTAIESAQALMGTFYTIGAETFPRAMKAAADMAAVTGSLESATLMLSKALDDPIEGLTSLSRQGFRFSDAQKEMIAGLIESNQKLEAQAYILDSVEKSQRGVSAAIAATPAGRLTQLQNEYSNLQAELGERLIPTFIKMQETLNSVTKLLSGNMDIAIAAMGVAAVTAAGKMVTLAGGINAVTAAIKAKTLAMAKNPLFLGAMALAVGIVAVNRHLQRMNELTWENAEAQAVLKTKADGAMASLRRSTEAGVAAATAAMTAARTNALGIVAQLNTQALTSVEQQIKSIESTSTAAVAQIESTVRATHAQIKALEAEIQKLEVGSRASTDRRHEIIDLNNDITKAEQALSALHTATAATIQRIHQEEAARIRDLGKAERDARAAALEQMRLDMMQERDREFAILESAYRARSDMFKGHKEGLNLLNEWYAAQIVETDKKYIAILDREREEEVQRREEQLKKIAEIEETYRIKILQQRGDEVAINEINRDKAIAAAREAGASIFEINKYYDEEQRRLEEDAMAKAQETYSSRADSRRSLLAALLTEEETIYATMYERQVIAAREALDKRLINEIEFHKLRDEYARQADEAIAKRQEEMVQRQKAALTAQRAMYASYFSGIGNMMGAVAGFASQVAGEQHATTKALATASTIANTAAAVMQALANQPPPLSYISAATAATMGTTQLAAIHGVKFNKPPSNSTPPTFSGNFWDGGRIPGGTVGLTQEFGPEIVRGPAMVTGGNETARMFDNLSRRVDNITQAASHREATQNTTFVFNGASGDELETISRLVRTSEADILISDIMDRARQIGAA